MRTLLFSVLVVSALNAPEAPAARVPVHEQPQELILLNWAEYLAPDVVDKFETEHNAKVRVVPYEDDQDRDRALIQSRGQGFDLVLIDGTSIESYVARGWIERIDTVSMPNLRHIRESVRGAHNHAREYAVPYLWGTLGIAYRTDLVPTPISSWRQLLEPEEALRGRILMVRDWRDLLTPALKVLGHSINTTDGTELKAAAQLLRTQRRFVKTYGALEVDEHSALVTGDVWAALTYNGDALALQEFTEAIEYVIPQDGTALWVDYWALSTHSRNPTLARAFLDFINRPAIAARNAELLYYATPNAAAERLLPKEFTTDPRIFPTAQALANSEYYHSLPPRTERRYISLAAEIVIH